MFKPYLFITALTISSLFNYSIAYPMYDLSDNEPEYEFIDDGFVNNDENFFEFDQNKNDQSDLLDNTGSEDHFAPEDHFVSTVRNENPLIESTTEKVLSGSHKCQCGYININVDWSFTNNTYDIDVAIDSNNQRVKCVGACLYKCIFVRMKLEHGGHNIKMKIDDATDGYENVSVQTEKISRLTQPQWYHASPSSSRQTNWINGWRFRYNPQALSSQQWYNNANTVYSPYQTNNKRWYYQW